PGRKFDCLGIGVAQSIFGKDFRQANGYDETTRSETMYEVYYSYSLNSALILTPSLQIVTNPNADKSADTEIVCGLRFLLSF
ncbi:MAG: carbohydrate porin, partial [Candidatus Omnitrophota bacterium]